jgi:hypothetical protein
LIARHLLLRRLRSLVVPDGPRGLCAVAYAPAVDARIHRQALGPLRLAIDVEVVPRLAEPGEAVVRRALAGLGGIVPRPRAANIRHGTEAGRERTLDGREGVGRPVGRANVLGRQPPPSRQGGVVADRGLEVVDDVLVLAVLRTVTLGVKGAKAGGVLRELVGPELAIGGALVDPEPGWRM